MTVQLIIGAVVNCSLQWHSIIKKTKKIRQLVQNVLP
jgi:hypothetical protein